MAGRPSTPPPEQIGATIVPFTGCGACGGLGGIACDDRRCRFTAERGSRKQRRQRACTALTQCRRSIWCMPPSWAGIAQQPCFIYMASDFSASIARIGAR